MQHRVLMVSMHRSLYVRSLCTWNLMPFSLVASTRRTASAVRTGTVDFSTCSDQTRKDMSDHWQPIIVLCGDAALRASEAWSSTQD
jgi:hypothetical protein